MLKLYKKILGEFSSLGKNSKIILFGSIAKGNYRLDSDIDLAIITDDARIKKKSSEIADKILVKYGKVVSLKYFTPKEFSEKKKQKNPFIMEILKGRVIYGGG
ncbi:MAG: nucleotidyltransferase domain-containing protein [Candidatus Aenigmatarchaeota archaeon]